MRIALGIVKFFPQGGLQRDCLRLIRILVARGHDVTLFAAENNWPLDEPPCPIIRLPVRAITNHGLDLRFARQFAAATARGFDCVVGFNKLTNLDVYYCADPPVVQRRRGRLERTLPRHRGQVMLEAACFGPLQRTHILALTESSREGYRRAWRTQQQRITVLQPSIDPTRHRPDLRTAGQRAAIRTTLGLSQAGTVWLWIGAQAHTKGLDRALAAVRSAPDDVTLLVVGLAAASREATQAAKASADIRDRVRFLGFREDIPDLMAAADLLVHPSRLDVTGQVILEAVVNGLPSVVTALCGFAEHVETSAAGIVLPEPFVQANLNTALAQMRDPARNAAMSQAGINYGQTTTATAGLEEAADVIARCAIGRAPAPAVPQAVSALRHMPISIIVTTYNRINALSVVMRGLANQSEANFEIIVADDGSSPATAEALKPWRDRLQQRLVHVWHEHRGFRAAEVRNRAILASRGAYCIFLDGDCIPRPHFVREHRQLAEPGWFVVGNRVLMSPELTDQALHGNVAPDLWRLPDAVRAMFNGDINRIAPLLQAWLGPARKIRTQYWWGARSCNLGVWRDDLDRVDGFDGSYVGWGLEDSDLLIRLLRSGVRRKDGRFSTGVLHLWHPPGEPALISTNQGLLDATRQSDRIRAVVGMSTLTATTLAPGSRGPEPEVASA